MEAIQAKLWEHFGKEDIKVSLDAQEFNLQQTGFSFFSTIKDVQFYVYEESLGIYRILFGSRTEQSLVWTIALEYYQGYLGSKFPTHLICVLNARGSNHRNEDGTFNGVIYSLTKNQLAQIEEEYEEMVITDMIIGDSINT